MMREHQSCIWALTILASGAAIGSQRFSSIWRVTALLICYQIVKRKPHVNACVILRPNNFDPPPVIFFPKLTRSKILTPSFSHTAVRCGSPTLRQVVSTWTCCGGRLAPRRAHEGYTAEPLRALVSEASPTTAIQVVRPAAPTASTRSLRMPTEQGHSALDSHKPTLAHGSSAAPG